MYGLAAIEQANGWAMAGAGACIVLSGLTVLSFLISMIPRVSGYFEEKAQPPSKPAIKAPDLEETPKPEEPAFDTRPDNITGESAIYMSLTESLGEDFSLVDLHRVSKEKGLPHPHLSINRFRDAGILLSIGDGRFVWQPQSE